MKSNLSICDQAANRFKAAEMPSSTAEAASVPAAIAEEETPPLQARRIGRCRRGGDDTVAEEEISS